MNSAEKKIVWQSVIFTILFHSFLIFGFSYQRKEMTKSIEKKNEIIFISPIKLQSNVLYKQIMSEFKYEDSALLFKPIFKKQSVGVILENTSINYYKEEGVNSPQFQENEITDDVNILWEDSINKDVSFYSETESKYPICKDSVGNYLPQIFTDKLKLDTILKRNPRNMRFLLIPTKEIIPRIKILKSSKSSQIDKYVILSFFKQYNKLNYKNLTSNISFDIIWKKEE